MKEAERGIKHQKGSDDRSLDIFAERQLQDDGDLKQDRNRRQEFAQNQPQRMNGDIGGRIRAELRHECAAPQRLKVP